MNLSEHLANFQQENKIEDVNPDAHSPWISNVVTVEKKDKQQIRMNIDMQEANKSLKDTAHHVETIQEIRHLLKGATHYSKMDPSDEFHQMSLHPDSSYFSTFRMHEGLHRVKVLFLEHHQPVNSSTAKSNIPSVAFQAVFPFMITSLSMAKHLKNKRPT